MLPTTNFSKVQPTKPDDFVFEKTLFSEKENKPKVFQGYSPEEDMCVSKKKILAVVSKRVNWYPKKIQKEDLSKNEDSHQDEEPGNKEDVNFESMWLVKKKGIRGPYTEKEMRKMISNGELMHSLIKRDSDKNFIPYDELIINFDDFLSSDGLNKYFNASEPVIITQQSDDSSYKDISKADIIKSCIKSKEFLYSRSSPVTLEYLEKMVSGKSFLDAVNSISKHAGLKKTESEEFLNLFLDESKLSILSDICPDGFIKPNWPRKGNRKH